MFFLYCGFVQDEEEMEQDDDQVEIDETFLPEKKHREISAEDKRKKHQKELAHQVNEEAKVLLLLFVVVFACGSCFLPKLLKL